MAVDLINIFGLEIKVVAQPRRAKRQLVGFAGSHGMTSMNMGTRGRLITVTGRIVGSGANYWAARANAQAAIDAIEAYQFTDGGTYTYDSQTFLYVVFEDFQLIAANGKAFHYTSEGYVIVNFVAILRSLI
ncbi:MAG: hypothetical protein FVQ82_14735 [Planctomycetes bacterium]|nr:hypothetical protein [Planctomycetota bacterium]